MSLLIGLPLVLGLLVISLIVTGQIARRRLLEKYPPVGRLVDVGGYQLHLQCAGVGGPTVVVDAGLGDFGLGWALVQPEVARLTRVCLYDRAGLGWSETSPHPRTTPVMAEELHRLLRQANVPGPYLLVGHSLGGLNMRYFAHRYPEDVAGLVLVDAAHEEQYLDAQLGPAFTRLSQMMGRMGPIMQLLVQSGLPAIRPKLLPGVPAQLPVPAATAYQALRVSEPRLLATAAAELRAIPESHQQVRDAHIESLGDMPLVVIMHGKREAMMDEAMTDANERVLHTLQPKLAAQSSRGRLLVAEHSGHNIPLEQPEIIVMAIRHLIEEVRRAPLHGVRHRRNIECDRPLGSVSEVDEPERVFLS